MRLRQALARLSQQRLELRDDLLVGHPGARRALGAPVCVALATYPAKVVDGKGHIEV